MRNAAKRFQQIRRVELRSRRAAVLKAVVPFALGLTTSLEYAGGAQHAHVVRELSADRAYLSIGNMSVIGKNGTTPFIPFKTNSKSEGSIGLWRRMWHMF